MEWQSDLYVRHPSWFEYQSWIVGYLSRAVTDFLAYLLPGGSSSMLLGKLALPGGNGLSVACQTN